MSNETVVAGSSPVEEVDVFGGQQPTLDEFSQYRLTGELPARFKPATDPEPSEEAGTEPDDAPEKTVAKTEGDEEPPESDPDSEPEEDQEPPKGSGAERRIKQLLAKVKALEERNQTAKQDAPPASSATAEPAPQYTRPKPTAEDKGTDGNLKYSTYEDFVEDLADWKTEQKFAQYQQQQVQKEALKALNTKLDEARSRYEDADDTIFPAAKTINEARIPQAVKEVFAQSDVFIDLCYVVGSDPAELKKFISLAQTNPRAAIGKVFEYERGIREELETKEPSGKAPEPKRTSAPKPPAPVGGGSSRAFDVSDESLSPEQWAQKRTAELAKRGKR
jgi:hypothetical protein